MSDNPEITVHDYPAATQTGPLSDDSSGAVSKPVISDALSLDEVTRLAEQDHMRRLAEREASRVAEADPLAHLPQRHREKVEAEMKAGARQVRAHARAFKAMEAQAEQAESTDGVHVSAEDILARQVATERAAVDRAAERRAAGIVANASKAAADHNEAYLGGRGDPSEEVTAAAGRLVAERLEQSGKLLPAHVPAEGVEKAREANTAKEIADRVNSSGYYDATTYQGVTGNIEVEHGATSNTNASLYDDEGNYIGPIDDGAQPGAEAAANPTAAHAAQADAQAEAAADATKPRRRPRPSPAEAVGQGPKSE